MRRKKPTENRNFEFARPMGDATRQARERAGFTQSFVSERTGIDTRTILNIENGNGNPTMEKLYPLVRFYGIDPKIFFYPHLGLESSDRAELRLLLETCTEQDAVVLIPIIRTILDALHSKDSDDIKI